jgi:hypothetical protein
LYYTRLAYNKEDWKKPSGSERKSLNFKTFERRYNFAFEEWLFDNSMIIDDKKYGFVQGIAKSKQKRLNQNKIIFFTLDSANNTRYKIAELEKWEFVKSSDSIAITKKFKINGWLKKMRKQVEEGRIKEFVACSSDQDGDIQIHASVLDLPGGVGLFEIGKHMLIQHDA